MLADAGPAAGPIEIPTGDPGALADAAAAWGRMAHGLSGAAGRVRGGGTAALDAGGVWSGPAAGLFLGYSDDFASTLDTAADGARSAASAARTFSHDLREAQQAAKRAARQWLEADRERRQAIAAADNAGREAADQRTAASGARAAATTARATPGPAGEATAQGHDDAAQRADAAAGVAADAARRAAAKAAAAEAEQERAVRAGERANRHAEHAARAAAQAFSHAAGQLRLPANLGDPPVPVTPSSGEANPFGPKAPLFGSPFGGLTPGDIRRVQIEERRKALEDATKIPQGSLLDGAAGLLHGATLGMVDPGGDKDSRRYKGGELASYLLGGGGLLKGAAKSIAKRVAARKAEQVAANAARVEAAGKAAEREAKKGLAAAGRNPKKITAEKAKARAVGERQARQDIRREAKREFNAEAVKAAVKLVNEVLKSKLPTALPEDVIAHVYKNWEMIKPYLDAQTATRVKSALDKVLRR